MVAWKHQNQRLAKKKSKAGFRWPYWQTFGTYCGTSVRSQVPCVRSDLWLAVLTKHNEQGVAFVEFIAVSLFGGCSFAYLIITRCDNMNTVEVSYTAAVTCCLVTWRLDCIYDVRYQDSFHPLGLMSCFGNFHWLRYSTLWDERETRTLMLISCFNANNAACGNDLHAEIITRWL